MILVAMVATHKGSDLCIVITAIKLLASTKYAVGIYNSEEHETKYFFTGTDWLFTIDRLY